MTSKVEEKDALKFAREYWVGDSRDGRLENGEGYHFYRMTSGGFIYEAYEVYERDDGSSVVTPLPEMQNINWLDDLGFEDFEALDFISEKEFDEIKDQSAKQ